MDAKNLTCRRCGAVYPLENRYSCDGCKGILEVTYDYGKVFSKNPIGNPHRDLPGMWKFRGLLPVEHKSHIVTLGEGDTPLLDAGSIAEVWGCDLEMAVKAEMLNPK